MFDNIVISHMVNKEEKILIFTYFETMKVPSAQRTIIRVPSLLNAHIERPSTPLT